MGSPGHFLPLVVTGVIVVMGVCQESDCYFDRAKVTEGEEAKLNCRFPTDVKENTKNFYVQISNATVFKVDEHVLADCAWPKATPGLFPVCTMLEGYANLSIDGFTVTINIPNAKKVQTGHYKCFVVNPDSPFTPKSCAFSVVDAAPETTTVWKPDVSSDKVESNKQDSSGSNTVDIGVGTGLTIVFVLAAVIVTALIYRKRKRLSIQQKYVYSLATSNGEPDKCVPQTPETHIVMDHKLQTAKQEICILDTQETHVLSENVLCNTKKATDRIVKSKRPNVRRGRREKPQEEAVTLQESNVCERIKQCEKRDRDAKEDSQPHHM